MENRMENEMEAGIIRRPWGACWMVAEGKEGENPLQPQNTKGGGSGGYPGFVSLQVPTSEAAVSADTHAFAREVCEKS